MRRRIFFPAPADNKNNFEQEITIMAINKKMTIEEILRTDYGIANILMESGMHCLGCVMASGEDLEQACGVHGIDCDALVEKINEYLENK